MTKTSITKAAYPGFEHTSNALTKFVEASGIFTILLKNEHIINFKPDDARDFRNWLQGQGIPDIRS